MAKSMNCDLSVPTQTLHKEHLNLFIQPNNFMFFYTTVGPFGDLRTLIIAKKYKFTMNIKFSIAGDICEGMKYLHHHGIIHGNLRSCAVYVEANWAAKVSD